MMPNKLTGGNAGLASWVGFIKVFVVARAQSRVSLSTSLVAERVEDYLDFADEVFE